MGKVIVIDVGHGGKDKGTSSEDVFESDINLSVALKIKDKLIKEGVNVLLTRDGDYDLSSPDASRRKKSDFDNRIKKMNQSKADYYLSIHLNMLGNSKYFGPQVFYNGKKNINQMLAEHIQKYLNERLQTNREVKLIPSTTYMYSKLNIPGVLIECGFLSNSVERSKLITVEYQKELATLIAQALIHYSI